MKHRKFLLGAFSAFVISIFSTPSWAQEDLTVTMGELTCPEEDGHYREPLVVRQDTAKKIYLAIVEDLYPHLLKRFPIVVADDMGKSWAVSQISKPSKMKAPKFKTRPGEKDVLQPVLVVVGRGQLSMRIDKCNGAVSEMYLAR